MQSPVEMMLTDLKARYADDNSAIEFSRLYEGQDFAKAFASIHRRLNQHFTDINGRIRTTHHYWAESSRELIALIDEVDDVVATLRECDLEVSLEPEYDQILQDCKTWLSPSHGSAIPDQFDRIRLVTYKPILTTPQTQARLLKRPSRLPQLKMIGNGSFATVYSYVDPDYGIEFALKRAKPGLSDRELARFREEFRILKTINYPYVVQVFEFSEDRNEYSMEYCHGTLRSHIKRINNTVGFATRKRISLQFLYGMNHLHRRGLLHRDVSLQNVLVKTYDDGTVLVKLSDFGLSKANASEFTRTQSELRGTILDPLIESFKNYSVRNEIYSVGHVLSYIFSGKESLQLRDPQVGEIIQRCVAMDLNERYSGIPEIIAAVEKLAI